MACVEGVPLAAQVDLEPGAEVHRVTHRRNADVSQVTGGITGRYIHAAAERDGQVRKVAADAGLLVKALQRTAGRARRAVVEMDALVHEIADRLNTRPAQRGRPEMGPRKGQQLAVDLAITAGQQKLQNILGQFMRCVLVCAVVDRVWQATVVDPGMVAQVYAGDVRGDLDTSAAIAE